MLFYILRSRITQTAVHKWDTAIYRRAENRYEKTVQIADCYNRTNELKYQIQKEERHKADAQPTGGRNSHEGKLQIKRAGKRPIDAEENT